MTNGLNKKEKDNEKKKFFTSISMTERDLLDLKQEVDEAAAKEQQLLGKKEILLKQFKKELKCKSVEELKEKRKALKKKVSKLDDKIDKALNKIEKKYQNGKED